MWHRAPLNTKNTALSHHVALGGIPSLPSFTLQVILTRSFVLQQDLREYQFYVSPSLKIVLNKCTISSYLNNVCIKQTKKVIKTTGASCFRKFYFQTFSARDPKEKFNVSQGPKLTHIYYKWPQHKHLNMNCC